jgi:NADPH-dependent 2,4-dienoyl-CoA reductase/sulfur reductase-like enzyme
MSTERLVVVGASAAGASALRTALSHGFTGRIDVVSRDGAAPYYRPGLSKQFLAGSWDETRMAQRVPDADTVSWHPGTGVTELDLHRGEVRLDTGEALPFDRLLLAGGCRPRRLPGLPVGGRAFEVHRTEDVVGIRAALPEGGHALVIGAGLIGSEVASTLSSLGARVTVVDPATAPLLRALGPLGNEACLAWHRDKGIDLLLGVGVSGIGQDGDGVTAELGTGETLTADIVVVCVGVQPDTEWLQGSGVPLLADGGIECGADLLVEGSDVVAAAGDAASWVSPRTGRRVRVEHWLTAVEQGTAAVKNLLADPGSRAPFDGLPMFWTEQHQHMVHVVGHHDPGADWTVVEGGPGEPGMVAAASTDGRVTGYLLVDAARRLGAYRQQLLAAPEASPTVA